MQGDSCDSDRPGRSSQFVRWVILGGTILLVLGPIGRRSWPHEWARWEAAKAYEWVLAGKSDDAMQAVDRILEAVPDADEALRMRMNLLSARGKYPEALATCNQLLESHPGDMALIMQRSLLYQHLWRHDDAMADVTTVFETFQRQAANLDGVGVLAKAAGMSLDREQALLMASAHNTRAYAIAVRAWHDAIAEREVDHREALLEALADAESAIALASRHGPGELASLLDTRGFVYYLLGDLQSALDDLDLALREEAMLRPARIQRFRESHPDPRMAVADAASHEQSLMVIRFHRFLALQKMGASELAAEQLRELTSAGVMPNAELF